MRRDTTILLTTCVFAVLAGAQPAARADEVEGEAVDITTPPTATPSEEMAPPPDYTREGWYLQAQGFYAFEAFRDFPADNDAGFNVLFGWRGWEMFGGDFEFEFVNRFPSSPGTTRDIRTYVLAATVRVWPLARLFASDSLANRIQPYVKAGPGYQWVEERAGQDSNRDRGDFSPRFGAGIDWYATENIVLTTGASYQLGISRVDNFRYYTVGGGLQYRFGGSR